MTSAIKPGGAYVGTNGQWHDANGKPIENPFAAATPPQQQPAPADVTPVDTAPEPAPASAPEQPKRKAGR